MQAMKALPNLTKKAGFEMLDVAYPSNNQPLLGRNI